MGKFGPGVGVGLVMLPPIIILAVLTLMMVWPVSDEEDWFTYRPPLFIVVTLAENWIVVVGLTLTLIGSPSEGSLLKAVGFFAALALFWGFTIVLASDRIQGEFIPELAEFRSDLIYPSGANLVRGEIFVGLGMEFLLMATGEVGSFEWLPV